jgi:hypothetical protein
MGRSAWRHLPAVLLVVGRRDLRADDDYAMGLAEIPISSQEVKERSDHLDTLPENNCGSPPANQKHEESQGLLIPRMDTLVFFRRRLGSC